MPPEFFTIGHSTRSAAEFVELLRASGVGNVVDVRHIPRSRTNPQFNKDALPATLAEFQIGYVHVAELGGLRPRVESLPPARNSYWKNKSFRNYADYAASESFHRGLTELLSLGAERPTAIMCAEAVWWRCHRRIIADYLIAGGMPVWHILGRENVTVASITPAAVCMPDLTLSYPASTGAQVGLQVT